MQKRKIQQLIKKYNEILLESMKNAVAEDLFNLIVLNNDDKEGELRNTIKNKTEFKTMVMKEFLKYNGSQVTSELSTMREKRLSVKKRKTIRK